MHEGVALRLDEGVARGEPADCTAPVVRLRDGLPAQEAGSWGLPEPLLTLSERSVLVASPSLAGLPAWLVAEVLAHGRVRNLRAHEVVPLAGDGLALCGLASGALAVRLRQPHSEVLDYLPPGSWLVDGAGRSTAGPLLTLEAHRRATVVCVPADAVAELAGRHDELQRRVMAIGWGSMGRLMGLLEDLSTLPLRQRLARCLLRLGDAFGADEGDGVRLMLGINQTEMGLMLRASRQRLNMELKELEAEGALRVEKELVVLDRRALAAWAAGSR